jgi:hypothetical protein
VVGPLLVTDTHVFASTAQSVHAVDLVTRQEGWSYAKGGHLALADGTLYIASADGTLTAITAPEVVHAALVSLEVVGPAEVVESSSASYAARAHYADGRAADRTIQAEWSVAPGRFAAVVGPGQLETRELIQPTQDVVVKARYSEQGTTVEGQLPVRIVIAVTPKQLVLRNVFATMAVKQGVLRDLEAALERERASLEVLLGMPSSPAILRARARFRSAICHEERARLDVEGSLHDLAKAVEGWRGAPPIPSPPAPDARPGRECVPVFALEEDGGTAQRP